MRILNSALTFVAFLNLACAASSSPAQEIVGSNATPHQFSAQEIVGSNATPHQFSSELRWRRPPTFELSAKVELFVRNNTDAPLRLPPDDAVLFDGLSASQHLADDFWAWHDTPSSWLTEGESLPLDCLTVFTINGRSAGWGLGTSHSLQIGTWKNDFAITQPRAWLSSVTFLSDDSEPAEQSVKTPKSINPNRVHVHRR
jgi:hypothetical protein